MLLTPELCDVLWGMLEIVRNYNIPIWWLGSPEKFFLPINSPSHRMSDYPAPEKLSDQDLSLILNKLRLLLENLPNQLPVNGQDSLYASLIGFQPDEESIEMTGSKAGALNIHLERMFGYAARSVGDGILPILERGPSICAIHDILRD